MWSSTFILLVVLCWKLFSMPAPLMLGSPALNNMLLVWVHQCWVKKNHLFSWPAGNSSRSTAEDTVCLLSSKGAWLCSFWCLQGLPNSLLPSCFPDCAGTRSFTSLGMGHGTSSYWTLWGSCQPFLLPVLIPLDGSTTLWWISHFSEWLQLDTSTLASVYLKTYPVFTQENILIAKEIIQSV